MVHESWLCNKTWKIGVYKKYYGNEAEYPHYANYDAININKVADIPCDYFEEIGVPITYLDKHNPDQFEIIGASRWLGKPMSEIAPKGSYVAGGVRFYLPLDNMNRAEDNQHNTTQHNTTQHNTTQHNTTQQYRCLYDRIVIKRKVQTIVWPYCYQEKDVVALWEFPLHF